MCASRVHAWIVPGVPQPSPSFAGAQRTTMPRPSLECTLVILGASLDFDPFLKRSCIYQDRVILEATPLD